MRSGECLKIGMSNDPERRLKELNNQGYGEAYWTLIDWFCYEDRKTAYRVEAYLHRKFRQKRVNLPNTKEVFAVSEGDIYESVGYINVDGKWFHPSEPEAQPIVKQRERLEATRKQELAKELYEKELLEKERKRRIDLAARVERERQNNEQLRIRKIAQQEKLRKEKEDREEKRRSDARNTKLTVIILIILIVIVFSQ